MQLDENIVTMDAIASFSSEPDGERLLFHEKLPFSVSVTNKIARPLLLFAWELPSYSTIQYIANMGIATPSFSWEWHGDSMLCYFM